MAVFGFIHRAFEVQDDRIAVFTEKSLAIRHGRCVGRASTASAVLAAAEHAFHAYPLGHNDFLRIDPLVVGVTFFIKYRIEGLLFFRCQGSYDVSSWRRDLVSMIRLRMHIGIRYKKSSK